ncbi:MAG: GNAT family N-acetyltransferase [Rhodanobacter sp.]
MNGEYLRMPDVTDAEKQEGRPESINRLMRSMSRANAALDSEYDMDDGQFVQSLTVRVIQDAAAWDDIRAEWDLLYAVSPTASTPLDFIWLRNWWRVYAPVYGTGGLRIITLWRGSVLVGALPLYIAGANGGAFAARCLRFVSTGEEEYEEICPDYLDLLYLPGEEMACVQATWAAIDAIAWDTLELLDLPKNSPLMRGLGFFPQRRRTRIIARGSCPIANIDGDFERYLAQLSSKTRMRARQEIRKAKQAGVVLELATEANAEACFSDLTRLHQARWMAEGKPGCFSAPRFTEFHRSLLQDWLKSGRLILARLTHDGKAYVALYGFVTGAKFDLYQLGVSSIVETNIHSPGTLANLLLMTELADRGVTRYDFLRGNSEFKKSLTTEHCDLVFLQSRQRNVRAWLDQAMRLQTRVRRKMRRMVASVWSKLHK